MQVCLRQIQIAVATVALVYLVQEVGAIDTEGVTHFNVARSSINRPVSHWVS